MPRVPSLMSRIRKILNIEHTPSGEKAIQAASAYTTDDPDDVASRRSTVTAEVGDPGTDTWAYLYGAVPEYRDDIPLKTYDAMRHGNGTVQAMLRVLQLPVMATPWVVVPGDKDADGEVASWVNRVLRDMDIPMHQVLFEIVQSFWSGFKMLEIVWAVKDGRIVVKKLAPRSPHSVRPVIDRHGNLVGAYQESVFMGGNRRVFIPKEKTFWYAHRMQDGCWYGESDLKAAYPHYENLRKLYIIDNKTHEVTAIPIRVAKPNVSAITDVQKREVFEKLKRIGLDTAIFLPREVDLEFVTVAAGSASRKDSIDHHTTMMAMSILAHFLQLGTNGEGTYNLSQDQSDLFLTLETVEMSSIASAITQQVIKPMVTMNVGEDPGLCPRFEFSDMTDHVRKTIESIFLAIAQQGNRLSDDFIEALSQRVVMELGLDLSVNRRIGESVPRASKSDEELMKERELAIGMQQKAMQKNPQVSVDNKASSKANMSTGVMIDLISKSDNAKDLFGKMKNHLSNAAGIATPSTPDDVSAYLETVDLSNITEVAKLASIAEDLVNSHAKEV